MVGGVKAMILLLVVVCVGCGGDPNKKANELFVEAVQLIASGDEQTGEAAIKDYEQGLANIQTIIADYSESDLAVKLISGETLFTGKSLKEIKERVKELKRIAAESVVVTSPERSVEERFLAGELTRADYEKVTELNLGFKQLTEGPKGLERFTQLKTLILFNNELTSVKGLEKLTQLERLWLHGNQLTDVKGLENLKQLSDLNLNGNQLTDVKGLEKLTQLVLLNLESNPALTKAQIDELKKALPKCIISSDFD